MQQGIAGNWSSVPDDFVRSFRESTLGRPLSPAQIELYLRESKRVQPVAWSKVASALVADARVVASRIDQATLILWGERDAFFDRSAQARLQAALKQQKLIAYPDVGHAPNLEIADRVRPPIYLSETPCDRAGTRLTGAVMAAPPVDGALSDRCSAPPRSD